MSKAQRKLSTYFKYRITHPFYWKNFSYENKLTKKVLELGAFLPLPAYDDLGRRVILERVCQLIPVDLIDVHCQLITWIFFQVMYNDKQAQVRYYFVFEIVEAIFKKKKTSQKPFVTSQLSKCRKI